MAATHPWLRTFAALLLCGGLYLGFVSAQEPGDAKKSEPPKKLFELPKVLAKPTPESPDELREIEKHVQKVLQ